MRNTELLYEDNPNKYGDGTLRINRLKSHVSLKVVWQDVSGKYHTNWFVPNTEYYRHNYYNVPDFEIWNFPEDGVRKFLTHCPLHDFWVEVWRND